MRALLGELFCLALHFLLLSLFLSSLSLSMHFYFHCANLGGFFFLCKLSNSFVKMCAALIKGFRVYFNSGKCVDFTTLRNNLLNELTFIPFHNYICRNNFLEPSSHPLFGQSCVTLEDNDFLLFILIVTLYFWDSLAEVCFEK